MNHRDRFGNYLRQNNSELRYFTKEWLEGKSVVTPKQRRRLRKKENMQLKQLSN